MFVDPTADELLGASASFLKNGSNDADGRFGMRVAASAVETVRRELNLRDRIEAEAQARLQEILGVDGPCPDLTQLLAEKIRDGAIADDDPKLRCHLILTVLEELKVDQPRYAHELTVGGRSG